MKASLAPRGPIMAVKRKLRDSTVNRNSTNKIPRIATNKIPRNAINGKKNKANQAVKNEAHIKTFNKYAVLSDDDEGSEIDMDLSSRAKKLESPKKVKIPPIVTIDIKIDDIKKMLSDANVTNFNLKYTSLGIKIFCTSLDEFKKVCNRLSSSKLQYFTHDVQTDKLSKFVLSGLPRMQIDEVKAGLTEAQIKFTDVKAMRSKSENPNYALYLVYFANKTTTLQELNKTKFILHVIIKWSTYIQAKNGPTQCNNCQLYGHGNKNCHLPPKCAKCGRSHLTSSCTKDQQTEQFIPKCCLCGQNHTSKSRECPKRLDYIRMRMSQSKQQREANSKQALPSRNAPNPTPRAFDSTKVTSSQKYSDWFKSSNGTPPSNERAGLEPLSDDLLSNETLLKMMKELFISLRSCRSKYDQLEAVTGIVLKYSTNAYDV